ncbi:hypothetical protein COLO4_05136 [Corchorus olitorius]|uniref:WAT1-related protein n=1 Tax=Corchorus olitorius TaxID=93759 RepID=A0A1R3KRW5_9ROSI|nr:hypothetical protein COLO4_05136 [Corchorus olitorius]
MGGWEDNKLVMAMVGVQLCYAGATLFTKAAILQGLSPRVLVVYRQALATLAVAPIAYISRDNQSEYILCYVGLDLATSSVASATPNLVPAITFLLASIFVGIIVGLYIVLWGKAEDLQVIRNETDGITK